MPIVAYARRVPSWCRAEADVLLKRFGHLEHRSLDGVGQLLHRCDEAIAAAVDRLHDLLLLAGVADGLAALLDPRRQR